MEWRLVLSEEEKCTARACLCCVNRDLEDLRALPAWWAALPEGGRSELKQYQAFVLMKLQELE
jgi:hypothetical protein